MTYDDILEALNELSERLELEPLKNHHLDPRVGTLYTDPGRTFIATRHRKYLDYYGGFEYIPSEYITQVNEYTIYSREHDRVEEAFND